MAKRQKVQAMVYLTGVTYIIASSWSVICLSL